MEKMKKLLCISLILFAFACASDPQKEMEKAIVGEWCNPYTYQSTGELKGFTIFLVSPVLIGNLPLLFRSILAFLKSSQLCILINLHPELYDDSTPV